MRTEGDMWLNDFQAATITIQVIFLNFKKILFLIFFNSKQMFFCPLLADQHWILGGVTFSIYKYRGV